MIQNGVLLLIILVIVSLYFLFTTNDDCEEFRGRGGRRGGRRGSRRGSRGGRHGFRRFHRGHRRAYVYPSSFVWYNPWRWFNPPCKTGCVSVGNGRWGCQYPGPRYEDCVFESDCIGCGY